VSTVITFASVSNRMLLQNGQTAGRVAGWAGIGGSGMVPTMLLHLEPAICSFVNSGSVRITTRSFHDQRAAGP
jgi:hypothetical protein